MTSETSAASQTTKTPNPTKKKDHFGAGFLPADDNPLQGKKHTPSSCNQDELGSNMVPSTPEQVKGKKLLNARSKEDHFSSTTGEPEHAQGRRHSYTRRAEADHMSSQMMPAASAVDSESTIRGRKFVGTRLNDTDHLMKGFMPGESQDEQHSTSKKSFKDNPNLTSHLGRTLAPAPESVTPHGKQTLPATSRLNDRDHFSTGFVAGGEAVEPKGKMMGS